MQDLYGLGASGIPLEYASQMQGARQQQMIAQAMLQQSQDPLANQAPGVAVSPFQGLAKIAQAYIGAKGMQNANQAYQGIGEKYTADKTAAMNKVTQAMTPSPAVPIPMANANGVEGQMIPKTPAEQQAVVREALLNQHPEVRQFATTVNSDLRADRILESQQAQQDKVLGENREIRAGEKLATVEETKRREQVAAEEKAKDRESAKELRQLIIDSRQGDKTDKGDKAPSGYRYKPDGSLESIPGGPADQKQTTALSGRETVSSIVGTLRDHFDQLSEGGGIVDSSKGALSNISAGLGSSGLGQAVGKMVGTGNQSQRNSIEMTRPLLLQAIMKATGMSAKQMDSNTELKLYLSTATNPQLDRSANLRALDQLENLYGLGEKEAPKGATPPPAATPAASKGGAKFLGFE